MKALTDGYIDYFVDEPLSGVACASAFRNQGGFFQGSNCAESARGVALWRVTATPSVPM
jgi:hypothetical protein